MINQSMQSNPAKPERSGTALKIILAVLLILGAAMILAGVLGIRDYNASGFNSESAYSLIPAMSREARQNYEKDISPLLAEAGDGEALDAAAKALLAEAWETDENAVDVRLAENVRSDDKHAALWQLLDMTYAIDGPRVTNSIKKTLPAVSEAHALRLQLLAAAANQTPATEENGLAAIKGLDKDPEDYAMMVQLALVLGSEEYEPYSDSVVTEFKRAVASEQRADAYITALNGDISFFQSIVIPHGRTTVLLGILLCLDIALLFFLLHSERVWKMDFKWVLILLIVDFLLVFQLFPMVYLCFKAFFPNGSFSLETFTRLYTYSMNWDALKNTLIAATATMILGTLLAFPLAWLVGRSNMYGRKFFRSLFVLTYMVPPYVGAMAWLRLLNNNVGTINLAIRAIFGLQTTTGPLNIYSLGGLIWVLTTFYYPYAFITISRAMEKMDPSLEEASRISGANPFMTVLRITLPMMTPSLIAGALLVFVCAASCYGIPSIIGAPGRVHTVTTRIIEYYGIGAQGINDATGMAVFLMVIAVIVLYVSDFVVAKRQYITVSGKSMRPNIVDLRKWRIPITALVALFAVIVILLPFATILITSFKIDVGKSVFNPENFTLSQWTTIFGRSETMMCLKNSLIFGAVTATVGIIVACVMSYLLQRTRIRGRKLPDFLITLGSGTPSVVIALGLIMTMRGNFGVNIYNTAYILIIAYLIKYLMMGMRTVVSAMSQIHVSLEECSQISGASWLKTMFKITGPLIFPSIAAGWFLIFIPSFYELSMTTLLYSNTTKTIGFQLYQYWTFTSQPQSCAMAFGILLIVVFLNFILNRLTKGEFSI